MGKKLKIEFIRAEFKKEGYELLTKVYENAHQKLDYVCPIKHKHSITWSNWNSKRKSRCAYCNGQGKPNIEFIRSEFAKEGYILLTKTYDNNRQKLEYICGGPEKHRHNITWGHWKDGDRCPYCANNVKLKIEYIRAEFAKEGYILLTEVYDNSEQKLEYICPRGHYHSIIWSSWNSKKKPRCPYCVGKGKPTIEHIRADFAKEGYILLTTKYNGTHSKLEYICPRGHKHSVSWANWNSKRKQRCPFCNTKGISKWEKIVKKFLVGLNIDYIPNDKTQLINPLTKRRLELDMWMPKLNKAIECNGTYWHGKEQVSKNDKIKKQLCKDQGIDLLVITDEEWNDDTDKCKNKIQEFLC